MKGKIEMSKKNSVIVTLALSAFMCLCGASSGFAVGGALPNWDSDFVAATNAAAKAHRPLVLFWANTGCDHCEKLEDDVQSAAFTQWMEESGYLFCYVLGKNGKDPDGTVVVRNFAGTAAGTANKSPSNYPYLCLYWPKYDAVAAVSFTTDSAATLKSRADAFFAGYEPIPDYLGGDLAFTSEYANARLEAEVGFTTYVDVPLVRDVGAGGFVATNILAATFGGVEMQREVVAWRSGETERMFRVSIPAGAMAGDEIAVSLSDNQGAVRGSVRIFVVAKRENSTKNPYFIGEKTVGTLAYGEWTMDLDVAMAKYRAEPDARLMAVASGSLWCPDCVMTDEHVLETAAFKSWAVEHKVILVDIDVPNFPNTTNSACLLTYVTGRTSDGYISGRGTLATNELERYQSGAGYLSRRMVSAAAAKAVLDRNRSLVGRNTLNGGWNNPNRANQNRTGIPNFFALRRDGTLAGTFETFDAIGPSEFKEAYLSRFTELVECGANSTEDFANRSWQTTKELFAGDNETSASLSAIDLADAYRLAATADVAAGQTVTVKGNDANATVTVSLVEVVGGTAKTLATSTGRLSDGVSATGVISSTGGSYYVLIEGEGSGALAADSPAASTVTAYTLSGRRVPIDNPFTNEWTTKAATATLPLYASDGVTLEGILALSLKKKGKITAKYSAGGAGIATFTGNWDADIAADGTATARIEKKGVALSLVMGADGVIAAEVDDGEEVFISGECGLAEGYGEFAGSYTVAFPSLDCSATMEPSGDAVMTLKMATSASARRSGQFKYTVYLPDGKKLTGSTGVTWVDANFGIVPVLRTVGAEKFAASLKVRRNAGSAPSSRAVIALNGTDAVWTNSTKGRSFKRMFAVRGSWYDKKDSLLVGIADETLALEFTPMSESVAPSPAWGALLGVAGDGAIVTVADAKMFVAKTKGFTFKLNRTTGIFSGTSILSFEGKARMSAKYTGVLLRGWFSDCDCGEDADNLIEMENVAFGLGHCLFSDKIAKKTVKRSFPVEIK